MRYITKVPDGDEINRLAEKFNLPLKKEDLGGIQTNTLEESILYEIAGYVINTCQDILPESIDEYWGNGYSKLEFEEDLKQHLILNALISQEYNNPAHLIDDNIKFCDDFLHSFSFHEDKVEKRSEQKEEEQEEQEEKEKKEEKEVKGYKDSKTYKNGFKNTSEHLKLERDLISIESGKSFSEPKVPFEFFPFIFHMVCYWDFTKAMRENTIRDQSKINSGYESFELIFDKYLSLNNPKNTWILKEPNKLVHYSTEKFDEFYLFNSFLFEREYNILLIGSTLKRREAIFNQISAEILRVKINKTISLLSILPNAISRTKFLSFFDFCNKDNNASDIDFKLSELQDIFLHMSLVTIPVMEQYFCYLLYRDSIRVGTTDIIFNSVFEEPFDIGLFKEVNTLFQSVKRTVSEYSIQSVLIEQMGLVEEVDDKYSKIALKISNKDYGFELIKEKLGI